MIRGWIVLMCPGCIRDANLDDLNRVREIDTSKELIKKA